MLTNREDGTTVEVELIDIKDGKLICFAKGRQFVIPLASLVDEDVAFLMQWGETRQ